MGAPQMNPLAIISLVLGLVTCIPGAGIGAIICGFLARGQIAREPQRYDGGGMAVAGIILGFLHVFLWVAYVLLFVVLGVLGAAAGR
jgi:hypothetical protein